MRGGGHHLWGAAVGGSLVAVPLSLQAYPPSHVRQDGTDGNDNKQDSGVDKRKVVFKDSRPQKVRQLWQMAAPWVGLPVGVLLFEVLHVRHACRAFCGLQGDTNDGTQDSSGAAGSSGDNKKDSQTKIVRW